MRPPVVGEGDTLNALVPKKVYCCMIGSEQLVDRSSPVYIRR